MGALFGKHKRSVPKVTEQDRAVLQLKQQRDKIKQYQKRIQLRLEDERNLARQLLQNGQKDRALTILKKKKYFENLIAKHDELLDTLEKLVDDISFAQIEVQVVEGLEQGNKALKELNKILSIERVESILEETREGIEKQREIDQLIGGTFSEEDEVELLEELEQIVKEVDANDEDLKLPKAPQTEPEDIETEEKENEKVTKEPSKRQKQALPAS
ncbi:charged multivesicular body protein 6-B [Tetranychus urticae]|uniref:Charged multivesicular body protein 6 n=1 Tax=Tetranychus urticae TaxID=32264 RepID=T1KYF8_TETUR|nr:charged multivesicular body protein 6-B [Tetranychus urticae]XP_025017921.1 charged multivesicular body protein 6-B [Tetranychus urticae]